MTSAYRTPIPGASRRRADNAPALLAVASHCTVRNLLNGPRFWTLDQLTACTVGETLSFDGLDARQVGELFIPPEMNLTGRGLPGTTPTP